MGENGSPPSRHPPGTVWPRHPWHSTATHLTSLPTVMDAITFFTASFFFSFLSLFSSAFSSNISPEGRGKEGAQGLGDGAPTPPLGAASREGKHSSYPLRARAPLPPQVLQGARSWKSGFNFPNVSLRATAALGAQLLSVEMETSMLVHPCGSSSYMRAPEGFKDHRHCRNDEHQHPAHQAQDMGFTRQVFLAMGQLSEHTVKPQPCTWLLGGPPLPEEPTAAQMTAGTHSSEHRQILGTALQDRERDGGSQILLCMWQRLQTQLKGIVSCPCKAMLSSLFTPGQAD